MRPDTSAADPDFNPFANRQDRDVRNVLSEALNTALQRRDVSPVIACVDRLVSCSLPARCKAYVDDRLAAYGRVLDDVAAVEKPGDETAAVLMWNRHLFFECHEWLEIFWKPASGARRNALQGWIMAAGAFSQLQSGRENAAASLARKAVEKLTAHGSHLDILGNLDDVIQGLADTPPVPVAMILLPCANAIENHQP